MTTIRASGIEPGQRRLNGPQTTGRNYRNLSQPTHTMTRDDDVPVPMRDGINLLADVHRPGGPERYPVLIAASPYPRQIQDLGAPAGFIRSSLTRCLPAVFPFLGDPDQVLDLIGSPGWIRTSDHSINSRMLYR